MNIFTILVEYRKELVKKIGHRSGGVRRQCARRWLNDLEINWLTDEVKDQVEECFNNEGVLMVEYHFSNGTKTKNGDPVVVSVP